MLDLGRLRMLRELKLRGTVGAVADALGYSPSAVSQQLAQLQKDVGVPLVEKVGRRLRLTEAGETLAGHAEVLLAGAQRAEEETIAASGRVAGVVRMVGFQTALLQVLAPALPKLAQAYPELVVDVLDEEFHRVLEALVKAEIDVVLTDEYTHLPRPNRPELVAEVLITEPMQIALAEDDPLAADGVVSMAALADHAWATGHVGTNHADLLERTCVELGGFRPIVRYRSNDFGVIYTMVARARGAGLVPHLATTGWGGFGLVACDIAEARLLRRMVMWTRVGADVRPSVRALLDALRESADALVARLPGLERGE